MIIQLNNFDYIEIVEIMNEFNIELEESESFYVSNGYKRLK